MPRWSKLDDDEFVESVQKTWAKSRERQARWRHEAREMFRLAEGHHYTDEEEREALSGDQLPPVFNKAGVYLSAVSGLESLNRDEVQFIARTRSNPDTERQGELLTDAARYIEDDCDAASMHSDAFADAATVGLGWTQVHVDWTTNQDGDVCVDRRNPLSMTWDHRATKRNLSDSRWRSRLLPMTVEEIEDEFDVDADKLDFSSGFVYDLEGFDPIESRNPREYYTQRSGKPAPDDDDDIYVLHIEWWETEPAKQLVLPDGSREVISVTEYKGIRDREQMLEGVLVRDVKRRKYMQAWLVGKSVLKRTEGLADKSFSYNCITGKYDRSRGCYYGLARAMKDPSQWLNKLYAKILMVMQFNSYGTGLLAEENALTVDTEEALCDPRRIPTVADGAIANGRVMFRQPIPWPAGLDRLMEFAMSMFPEVTGISPEMLGLVNKVQPGVLESQRKQASMTVLGWLFDSLRSYRVGYGRTLASVVRDVVADQRLVRIASRETGKESFVPLDRTELAAEYDIVVTDSPRSTNERERVFGVMTSLAPILERMGVQPPEEAIDYLPLPPSLITAWKEQLAKGRENPAQKMIEELKQRMMIAQADKMDAEALGEKAKAFSDLMSGLVKSIETSVETGQDPMQAVQQMLPVLLQQGGGSTMPQNAPPEGMPQGGPPQGMPQQPEMM